LIRRTRHWVKEHQENKSSDDSNQAQQQSENHTVTEHREQPQSESVNGNIARRIAFSASSGALEYRSG
jgi:hypothetical protein